jgi:hypothetical protein
MQVAERAEGGEHDALAAHGAAVAGSGGNAGGIGIKRYGYRLSLFNDNIVPKPNARKPVLAWDVGGISRRDGHNNDWRLAMNAKNPWSARTWTGVLFALVLAAFSGAAAAEIVATEELAQQTERERVQEFLGRQDVENKLKQLGVAPEEARRRVDAMTPGEIQLVAGKMDTLTAGGALSSTDWIIILLVAIIVLLIV